MWCSSARCAKPCADVRWVGRASSRTFLLPWPPRKRNLWLLDERFDTLQLTGLHPELMERHLRFASVRPHFVLATGKSSCYTSFLASLFVLPLIRPHC